jgi:hypothetical protein
MEDLKVSLIEKRQSNFYDDPLEEVKEVYEEVKQMEVNFRKALEVCGMIESILIYIYK